MDTAPLDDLAAHAHDTHVVVVGGGIGGLVAALACAKIGIRVTLVEASDRLGGALCTAEVGGVRVDVGAEGYATRGGAVRALVEELGLADAVTPTSPRAEWIGGLPGGAAPVPDETVRGIPENPWDERVRRMIGWRGAWRAYLDRLRPPLTIGQERSLGRLVRTRMGELVLDRLVAPLSLGAFAIHPDDVDVEVVAPGLSAALTRTGSLAGGVVAAAGRRRRKAAGRGPRGDRRRDVAAGRCAPSPAARARARRSSWARPWTALEARGDGRWTVGVVAPSEVHIDAADHVIVATGAADAHRLLVRPRPVARSDPRSPPLEVVTLVVSSPALEAAPPRTAVYPVPGSSARHPSPTRPHVGRGCVARPDPACAC